MTVTLWNKIQAKMLPTPAKFHYLFNMRELSKVFQGIILATRDRCEPTCCTCIFPRQQPWQQPSSASCVVACSSGCITYQAGDCRHTPAVVLLSFCLQVQHAQGQSKHHSAAVWWCCDKSRGLPAGAVGA
jgi:hypothetical protein